MNNRHLSLKRRHLNLERRHLTNRSKLVDPQLHPGHKTHQAHSLIQALQVHRTIGLHTRNQAVRPARKIQRVVGICLRIKNLLRFTDHHLNAVLLLNMQSHILVNGIKQFTAKHYMTFMVTCPVIYTSTRDRELLLSHGQKLKMIGGKEQ